MIANASCTVYNQLTDGSFKRTFLPFVFWRNVRAEQIKKYGAENASTVSVMVFADELSDYVSAENFNGTGWTADTLNDTYIVKGECHTDISEGGSALFEENREAYKVCTATENLYGSDTLHHIVIEGK